MSGPIYLTCMDPLGRLPFITPILGQVLHNTFNSDHTMSRATNTAKRTLPCTVSGTVDYNPRQFEYRGAGYYGMAVMSPADGNATDCRVMITAGTPDFPSQMTADFSEIGCIGVFNAQESVEGGGPQVWLDNPTEGRNKVYGTISVS